MQLPICTQDHILNSCLVNYPIIISKIEASGNLYRPNSYLSGNPFEILIRNNLEENGFLE